MKILQIGVAKSGNFWLHSIIQSIIKEIGLEKSTVLSKYGKGISDLELENLSMSNQKHIDVIDIEADNIYFRISSIIKEEIDDVSSYLECTNHVWTHSGYCSKTNEILKRFDKKIYIIRDPRDVTLSMSRFMMTPYMKKYYPNNFNSAEEYLAKNLYPQQYIWANHLEGYINNTKDVYYLFYERMLVNFQEELEGLLNYLGVSLTHVQKDKVIQENSFSSMKAQNANHVSKAKLYGWDNDLNAEQKKLVVNLIRNQLNYFNYPTQDSDTDINKALPRFPTNNEKFKVPNKAEFLLKSPSKLKLVKEKLMNRVGIYK